MNMNKSRNAFTLVEIMIVVAIIGLLAAIAIPNFVRARATSHKNACVANLKQIDGAKATWAIEKKKVGTDTPAATELYGSQNYIRDEPTCPASGTYTIGTVAEVPTCSHRDISHTWNDHALPGPSLGAK